MNINKDIRLIMVLGLLVCVVYFAGLYFLRTTYNDAFTALDKQEMSLALSREMSQNSYGLTNYVRGYVASGLPEFKALYMDILDVRSGVKDRPATAEVMPGVRIPLNDLVRSAGFTDEERRLMELSGQLSSALAEIETETMNMVENAGPDEIAAARVKAIAMLYGDEYKKAALEIQEPVKRFQELLLSRLDQETATAINYSQQIGVGLMGLTVFAAIMICGAIWWLRKRVLGSISNIASQLGETSDTVAYASKQIAESGNDIAEMVAGQASALEETSSALEEMAAMTKQNAENSTKTNETTRETLAAINEGTGAVDDMSQAMNEINESSGQITRIIKTIEEIAFQTNLLALNAAVEAARAGEAGKGFAVVADEVRNLAQRSAQAARDTSSLIESTVARVKRGADIADRLSSDFTVIEDKSRQIGDLIQAIATATDEQSRGMEQINSSVAEIDKLTQRTAASTRESADSSAKLNEESENLSSMTAELIGLIQVGNNANQNRASRPAPVRARLAPSPTLKQLPHNPNQSS